MNLRNVVTIGTYRGGSVVGLEQGKGCNQSWEGKITTKNTSLAESCTQKMCLSFSQIYHHLLKLLTSLLDIFQPFFQISGRNFIYQISNSDGFFVISKELKYLTFERSDISEKWKLTRPGFSYVFDHFQMFLT